MDLYEPTDEPYTEPVTRKIALKLVTHGSVSVWWVDAIPYAKGLVPLLRLKRYPDVGPVCQGVVPLGRLKNY